MKNFICSIFLFSALVNTAEARSLKTFLCLDREDQPMISIVVEEQKSGVYVSFDAPDDSALANYSGKLKKLEERETQISIVAHTKGWDALHVFEATFDLSSNAVTLSQKEIGPAEEETYSCHNIRVTREYSS